VPSLPSAGREVRGKALHRPGDVLVGQAGDAGDACSDRGHEAIAALPPPWQAGHHRGDHGDDTAKELVVRADAAGASHWLAENCRERNIALLGWLRHR
jgi:hypothetical protein